MGDIGKTGRAAAVALLLLTLLALLAAACKDGEPEPPRSMGIDKSHPDCLYEFTDSGSGEVTEGKEFPPGLYPSEYRELGSGLSITLVDPLDEERPLTLTVPQCLKEDALAIIEARQQANEEQEEAGVPFEERVFE
jgi:hypothetical protein